jgi:osmoprotectant transport system substrate-binding protein
MNRTAVVLCAITLAALAACSRPRPLTVGSKDFTEQVLLGEIVAQHVEHRLSIRVERRLNLQSTLIAHQALNSGSIDLYPEYTGTALSSILKLPAESDPNIVLERVRNEYRFRSHIEWLDPLGFSNSFAMVVRGEDARANRLETLSDAAAYAPGWTLGISPEFMERRDGYPSLRRTYELHLVAAPKNMAAGALYKALADKQVSMMAGYSTDGLLAAGDRKALRDDKGAFPPCQAALVVRTDALARFPGLRQALAELSGKLPEATMRNLNYQVDAEHRPASQVARAFLRQAGLLH